MLLKTAVLRQGQDSQNLAADSLIFQQQSQLCLSSIVLYMHVVFKRIHYDPETCSLSLQQVTCSAGASGVYVQNVNFASRLSTDGVQAALPQSTCLGMH